MKKIRLITPVLIGILSFMTWSFVETKYTKPSLNTNPNMQNNTKPYKKAFVDYDVFEKLTAEAKVHRTTRLIDFKTFNQYAKEENTIVLDTRSKRMYDKMHIKDAIHINFSDFTQDYLAEMIPDLNTRILIYCNNNFEQEPVFIEPFPTKMAAPISLESSISNNQEANYTMALNIPTYINLYGYHYRNVYELDELISSKHPGLELEGTDVQK
ncbi:MAG: rhodanese-like domain-containing protein [Putridiphycobacter sp.]